MIQQRSIKWVKILALIAVTTVALLYGGWQLSRSRTFQLFGELYPRVQTTQRLVALTFDDGPTPKTVQVLLPLLGERGIHATFYLIGAELERNPEAGRALVEAGHELGNHSYTHQRMVFKGAAFVERELARTDALIRQTGYTGSIHFRPPYGKKLFTLPLVLRRAGRKTITWDIEPDSDPKIARDENAIVATTVSAVRPGSIILLHTMYRSGAPSLAAVPEIIDQLQRKGYRFVTVSELIAARTL